MSQKIRFTVNKGKVVADVEGMTGDGCITKLRQIVKDLGGKVVPGTENRKPDPIPTEKEVNRVVE